MSLPRITPSTFSVASWNGLMDALEGVLARVVGRGVLSGLAITAGSGLTLNIAAGTIWANGLVALDADTATCPNNVTRFVWIDSEGLVTFTATSTDIGGEAVCLGQVVTSGGSITSVSDTGRVDLGRFDSLRTYSLGGDIVTVNLLTRAISLQGSAQLPLRSVSSDITVGAEDYTLVVNSSAGVRTITLPAASALPGRVLNIKRQGANTVNVVADGADTIDGTGTVAISTNQQTVTIQSTGTGWVRLT